MSTSSKLMVAAIVFLLYGGVAIYSGLLPGAAKQHERQLQARAIAQLDDAGLTGIEVSMDGQAAYLRGEVPSAGFRARAIEAVRKAAGGGGVAGGGVTVVRADDLVIVDPAPPAPFIWSATRDAGRLTLAGLVPSDVVRRAVIRHAEGVWPDGDSIDQSKNITLDQQSVGPDAPAGDWLGAVRTSLDALGILERGKISANGPSFTLTGLARVPEQRDAARTAMAGLPDGFTGSTAISLAPIETPYVLTVEKPANGGPVVLSGFVPNEPARGQLLTAAAGLSSGGVTDNLTLARGMPQGAGLGDWVETITALTQRLEPFETATLKMRDRTIILTGRATDPAILDRLDASEKSLERAGYDVTMDIDFAALSLVEDASQCQRLFDDAMQERTIKFANASAAILPDSVLVLTRLGVAARQCQAFQIAIAGHTDSVGSASLNQRLSEARAKAVSAWLVEYGVDPAQLSARGFGETRPLADNETPLGRAKNRRIDFTIAQ
ncbi:MAG: OmpA family protein [Pseudomonadota bacterium]